MAFWRTSAYVARRLGREFLIWGGVVVVLYVVADQFMEYRYAKMHSVWAARYSEIFSATDERAQPCDEMNALAELHAQLPPSPEEHFYLRPEISRHNDAIEKYYYDRNNAIAEVNRKNIQPPKTDSHSLELRTKALKLFDAAAECPTAIWLRDGGQHKLPRHRRIQELMAYLLGSIVDSVERDIDKNLMDTTESIGRFLPRFGIRKFQQDTEARMLAVTLYVLATDRMTEGTAISIADILTLLQAHHTHPLASYNPEYSAPYGSYPIFSHPSTVVTRLLRPWNRRESPKTFALYHDMADAATTENAEERYATNRAIFTDTDKHSESDRGFLRSQYSLELKIFEGISLERDTLILMLLLETHRLRTGVYPKSLEEIHGLFPDGFDASHRTQPPVRYGPEPDGMGYTISRNVFRPKDTFSPTGPDRIWVRRYGEVEAP